MTSTDLIFLTAFRKFHRQAIEHNDLEVAEKIHDILLTYDSSPMTKRAEGAKLMVQQCDKVGGFNYDGLFVGSPTPLKRLN
jgi:hypothetical protein